MIIPYGQATNRHKSHVSSWFLKPGDPGLNSGVLQGPNIAGHTVCCTHTLWQREQQKMRGEEHSIERSSVIPVLI